MLVGTTKVNYADMIKKCSTDEEYRAYVDNLIPTWARHIKGIKDNQRYYVALHVRKILSLPYKERAAISQCLIEDIRVEGFLGAFVNIQEAFKLCNTDAIISGLKEMVEHDGQ